MNTKSIDLTNMDEDGEFAISFATRKRYSSTDVGHAFIIWFELRDAGKKYVRRASGFYPNEGKVKLIVADSGDVLDDSDTEIDKQLIVKVSSPSFNRALGVEKKYNDGSWILGINDCVSFIQSVGQQVTGLSVPPRMDGITPSSYVDALWESN